MNFDLNLGDPNRDFKLPYMEPLKKLIIRRLIKKHFFLRLSHNFTWEAKLSNMQTDLLYDCKPLQCP